MTNRKISIEEASENFLENNANVLFHSKDWLEVLKRSYDYQFFVVRDQHSEQYLIFAFIQNPFETKLVSLPFSDYSGELNLKSEIAGHLLTELRANFPGIPIIFKSRLVSAPEIQLPIENIKQGVYHQICLKNNTQTDSGKIQSSSFRRAVKKAEKSGVVIERSSNERDLKQFHQLFCELRLGKFQMLPQPYSFFRHIFEIFIADHKGFILKATHQESTIAAVIILEFNNIWYYKFGASGRDDLGLRPNNLIFDRLIQMAVASDIDTIDLGFSGSGASYAGLRRFKEQMGGESRGINVYKVAGDANKEGDKSMLSQLTKTIVDQKPDLEAVDKFSEILYPFFV